MSDRRAEVIEFVARITGTDPQQVRLDALQLSSAQQAALEGHCRRTGIDLSAIEIPSISRSIQAPAQGEAQSVSDAPDVSAAVGSALLGCDIQDISEFKLCIDNADYKRSAFLAEFASAQEIAYCEGQPDPLASLAGLMAAKEAIFKAGHRGPLKAIRIAHENAKPVAHGFQVSISHTGQIAFAVALGNSPPPAAPASVIEAPPRPEAQSEPERRGTQRWLWVGYQIVLLAAVVGLMIMNFGHR